MPFDMEPTHRQFNPLYSMRQSLRFFEEATATLQRKAEKAATDVWMNDSNLYPNYYRHTFHYQTDGWFSEKSAKVYDTSTETLFVGRQDAMQRHTLVPFGRFMQGVILLANANPLHHSPPGEKRRACAPIHTCGQAP